MRSPGLYRCTRHFSFHLSSILRDEEQPQPPSEMEHVRNDVYRRPLLSVRRRGLCTGSVDARRTDTHVDRRTNGVQSVDSPALRSATMLLISLHTEKDMIDRSR